MKPGTQLGPYEIVSMLGAGGMGEVYRARDTRLGREVAIKILPPEFAKDAELKSRFEREARTISSISDPHICALYDIGEVSLEPDSDGTTSYLVMEYLRGQSLADRIGRGPLPMEQVLLYGAEIAGALVAAHRLGIIHRDLKPGNVMITPTGAKLLDFGLAKSTVGSGAASEMPTAPITRSGAVVGTLQYMAPEQLEGREADVRTDIFSLGVVLYEMAAGRRAFSGSSPASLASSILRDEPGSIREANPLVPREFERLFRRFQTKDPEQRWQSAADIAAELRELRVELSAGHLEIEASQPGGESRRRRSALPARAGLLVLVLAVMASVVWVAIRIRPHLSTAPVLASVAPLTSQQGIEWFPSLSPDGKWVVYAGKVDRHRHIFLQSVGGQKALDLTEDSTADDDQPAFSPDGEKIAFRSSRDGGGIFVMGRTGEAARRLTSHGFRPTWSPDGTTIAFTSENVDLNPQNGEGRSELWIVDAGGGEPRLLLEQDAVLASWSPGGHRIAYLTRKGNPFQMDIWSVSTTGEDPVAVTDDAWTDSSPAWSPDGRFIYFASNRGGSMNLWRIAVDERTGVPKGEVEPVTVPATTVAHPSLSGDGAKIAYASAQVTINIQRLALDMKTLRPIGEPTWVTTGSRRWSSPDPSPDGEWVTFYSLVQPEGDVYVARRDGTGLRLLTGDDAIDRVPRWSPTGDQIAFFSTRGGPLDIWRIHVDGSSLEKASEGGGAIPAWSPDGKRIAAMRGLDTNVVVFDPDRPWSEQTPDMLPDLEKEGKHFTVNSWSPDGRLLAGSFGTGLESRGVVVFDLETRSHEVLTDFGEFPVWLPDNRRILFVAGGKEFYVVDVQTKDLKEIYSATTDVVGPPRLSSKGELFYSRRVTEADLWLATLE